jgi:sec-independent protein translocase protein TatC
MTTKKTKKDSRKEMSFLEHLEELRWHLIRATLSIVIVAVVAFVFKGFIFDTVIFGPKDADFVTYRVLCDISKTLGMQDDFCFSELPFTIQSRTVGGQFSTHIWVSIAVGFIIAFPYIIYEFWKFVSPGMLQNEKKSARGFIFFSSLLFFMGVLFGYYVITPFSVNFLGTYQVSHHVLNEFDLGSYIGLVRTSVLASGIIFELPMLIYLLTKAGIVSSRVLRKQRKINIVVVLTISGIITPPDVASQIIVSIPVLILYEISILIARSIEKNRQKMEAKNAAASSS